MKQKSWNTSKLLMLLFSKTFIFLHSRETENKYACWNEFASSKSYFIGIIEPKCTMLS